MSPFKSYIINFHKLKRNENNFSFSLTILLVNDIQLKKKK